MKNVITRSETTQPTSWPKCATMSASSLSFRSCQPNYCTMLLPSETMKSVLTFGLMGSGVTSHVILWCEHIQSQWTVQPETPIELWTTIAIRRINKDPMSSASEKWMSEHGSFTPLMLRTSGGISDLATTSYKQLASLPSSKHGQLHSKVMTWLQCHLLFSLLRSAVSCLKKTSSLKEKRKTVTALTTKLSIPSYPCHTDAKKRHWSMWSSHTHICCMHQLYDKVLFQQSLSCRCKISQHTVMAIRVVGSGFASLEKFWG